jgi:hypothetical protein
LRRRRRKAGLNLSADDARRALAFMVSEGKVAARDVVNALERRQKIIREITDRLAALGESATGLVSRVARDVRPRLARTGRRAAKAGRKGAKRAISAATRAKYQAQGRYMAAVRQLPKTTRAKIKKIREKSGVDAAVKAALAMARKPMRHGREGR